MAEAFPIIQTKLYRPPIPVDAVPRPWLLERLDRQRRRALTLVSAPAGYGKTTLVSSWLDTMNGPHAWVSLDEHDNDLILFLTYFLTAIRSMFPDAAEDTLALVNAPEQPSDQIITNSLINDLNKITVDFVLVLDDYHSIQDVDIHDLISGLLRYLPPTMHLVLATRSDPPLDLVNLLAQSRITEIRAMELRFNQAEVADYLRILLNRPVNEETAVFLTEKSEGWVTGIRLLALSLRRVENVDWTQIDRLENNHLVEDYLMSIILSRQEPALEAYLLQSAVLDRFCASLCTAVYSGDEESGVAFNGEAFIQQLTESNLFVVPLDTQQQWFRYHHLFQDLLLRQLEKREGKAFIASLHRKASTWYAQNGTIDEALRHALAAGDTEAAVALVAQHRHELMNREQWRHLERWLKQFPAATVEKAPDLLMAKAWIDYYFWYDLAGTIQTLDLVEDILKSTAIDSVTAGRYTAEAAALRSHFLYWDLNGVAAVTAAQLALEYTPPQHECVLSTALMGLGGSYQMLGKKDKAIHTVMEPLANDAFQSKSANARLLFTLCIIYYPEGDLRNLQQVATQFLQLSENQDMPWSSSSARYFLGIVHFEKNDLADAEKHLSFLLQEPYRYPMQNIFHSAFVLALVYQVQGQKEKAKEISEFVANLALERRNQFFIGLADILQGELVLGQGQTLAAANWAQQQKPGELRPMQRFYVPELTYIKALLAEDSPTNHEAAAAQLASLGDHASSIHAHAVQIKVLTLQALLAARQGDEPLALATLERAVRLAEPGLWIRQFVDLGSEMAGLLRQLRQRNVSPSYIKQILAAFPDSAIPELVPTDTDLPEPLTNRELEILALLSQGLTNKEIAAQLVISPGTVTQHTHKIYQKLMVKNRRLAVIEATKLGILSRD